MSVDPENLPKLSEPFHLGDLEFLLKATNEKTLKGLALPYVTNRAVQERLDEVCGPAGWRDEYKEWRVKGVLCGLSIRVNGEWITKWDGADETMFESTKGGLSGAEKRAGVKWGIGRYLYNLQAPWVPVQLLYAKNGKNHYKIANSESPYKAMLGNYPGSKNLTDGWKERMQGALAEKAEHEDVGETVEKISVAQAKLLEKAINNDEKAYEKFCKAYGLFSYKDLPAVNFKGALDRLNKYFERRGK